MQSQHATLGARIEQASSVRLIRRDRSETIAVVTDGPSLTRLRGCLAVDGQSLAQQISLMTPGSLELSFMSGRDVLTTVIFIWPNFLRWSSWTSDARLADGSRLIAWLTEHGWHPPG